VLLVDRPGWHGGRFLLGNKTLGLGSEQLMIDVPLGEHLPRVSRNGILRQWKQNVAQPCAASSYFVSALCLAFAAPLLRLANEVDLPSESTQLLDRLTKKEARTKTHIFAERLRENAATYYGTAGYEFIKRLVADMAEHKAKLVTRIQRDIAELLAIVHVDVNDELQFQRGKLFGLAYAAGLFAIYYKVLPWDRSLLKRSIRRCYRCIPGQSGMPEDPIQKAAGRVIRRVRKINDVVDVSEAKGSVDPDLAESARVS
jgi:hypothetical protein